MSAQPIEPNGPPDATSIGDDSSFPPSQTRHPDKTTAAGSRAPGIATPFARRSGGAPTKAAARRTMLLGAAWFAAGIVVSVVTLAVTSASGSPGVIVWGLSLYGIVQVVRGAIAYGRADRVRRSVTTT